MVENMSSNAAAERAFSRVMASHGATRIQGLVKIARIHPGYAPIWAALAEEHWSSRRREEALQAARRAIKLDPRAHRGFSSELKMASRSVLAQIAPDEARGKKPEKTPKALVSVASVQPNLMLESALSLQDPNERVSVLEELHAIAPDDAEVLFHLAKQLAIVSRADDARSAGDELRQLSPERYNQLYAWATQNLAEAQVQVAGDVSGRSTRTGGGASREGTGRPTEPRQAVRNIPSSGIPNPARRAQPDVSHRPPRLPRRSAAQPRQSHGQSRQSHREGRHPVAPTHPRGQLARGRSTAASSMSGRPVRPLAGEAEPSRIRSRAQVKHDDMSRRSAATPDKHEMRRERPEISVGHDLDDAVTVDKILGAPIGDMPDDDVTSRSNVEELAHVLPPDDENATRRVDLRELERLASASMDPSLDD